MHFPFVVAVYFFKKKKKRLLLRISASLFTHNGSLCDSMVSRRSVLEEINFRVQFASFPEELVAEFCQGLDLDLLP